MAGAAGVTPRAVSGSPAGQGAHPWGAHRGGSDGSRPAREHALGEQFPDLLLARTRCRTNVVHLPGKAVTHGPVRNRLHRLEALSGQSLSDPRGVTGLSIATQGVRLLGRT